MSLLGKIKDWNLKRNYSSIGVALANIFVEPLEDDHFFYMMFDKMKKIYLKWEFKYIEAGYQPIDFVMERKNYDKPLSKKNIKHLVGKKRKENEIYELFFTDD